MKKILFVTFLFLIALIAACSSTTAPNGNSVSSNSNSANIPPEFSNKPVTPSGNSTPGIPDANSVNMNSLPKGTTPTPGIPDQKELNKPFKPGATPTPGIPDQETIKKQMNQRITNANIINQIPKNEKDLNKKVDDTLKSIRKNP
jgi:hypothetical protein